MTDSNADVETDDTDRMAGFGGVYAVAGRPLDGDDPLEAPLPAALGAPSWRLLDDPPMATLGGWPTAVRRLTSGVGADHLCHADGETPHRGWLDGETYRFRCFDDAMAPATLADRPVEVRTESPGGAVVKTRSDDGRSCSR